MSIAKGLSKTPRQLAQSGTKNDVRNAVCSRCRFVRTQALAPRSQCQPLDRCPAFRRGAKSRWSHIFFPPILSIRKRARVDKVLRIEDIPDNDVEEIHE